MSGAPAGDAALGAVSSDGVEEGIGLLRCEIVDDPPAAGWVDRGAR